MDITVESLRLFVYTRLKTGYTVEGVVREIVAVHGDHLAPCRTTVYNWKKEIDSVTFQLLKNVSSGRTKSIRNPHSLAYPPDSLS